MANRVTFVVEVPPLPLSHTLAVTALGNSNPIKIVHERFLLVFFLECYYFFEIDVYA